MKKAYALIAMLFTISLAQGAFKPLEKIKNTVQSLQSDIQCIRTNTCTEAQKQRIKKYLGIIIGTAAAGAVTIGATVGTRAAVGAYKLGHPEKEILEDIRALGRLVVGGAEIITPQVQDALDDAITAIHQKLNRITKLSQDGKKALSEAIDKLVDFPGKSKLVIRLRALISQKS